MKTTMKVAAALLLAVASAGAQRAPVKLPPRPEPGPPKPFVYPEVHVDSLPNGLRYAVVENHELPLVVVRMAFAGAGPLGISFLDKPGKEGAWGLTLASLREGTTSRSAAQIRDQIADLGVEMALTSTANASFTAPSFRAPRSAWVPALELLADIVRNPTFPAEGVSRVQTALGNALDRLAPISILNRTMLGTLYGADSPNNRFATSASLRGVTREDVLAMKDSFLRPQNTMMVIAGDITVSEARAAMAEAFGTWERGGTTVKQTVPKPAAPAPTTIYLVDRPGLAQTLISTAQVLPGRQHPDAAALETLSSLVGDASASSGSRLYNAFRAERGLSYAMRVERMTRPIPETAPLLATLSVAPGSVDTAATLLRTVFAELRQARPATASELEFAKRSLVGRLPMDMERIDNVAVTVLMSLVDGVSPEFLNQWVKRIDAVTLPEVQAAAAKYLDPDHMPIVMIGDRARMEAALRATGIPVVIVGK